MNEQDIQRLLKIRVSASDKEYSWVKNVVSIVSILLGVLVSLKDKSNINTETESILFIITIIFFGLCILSGLIFLYADSDTEHRVVKKVIEKESQNPHGTYGLQGVMLERRPIFYILRICFFASLILSVLSLVLYSVIPLFLNLL